MLRTLNTAGWETGSTRCVRFFGKGSRWKVGWFIFISCKLQLLTCNLDIQPSCYSNIRKPPRRLTIIHTLSDSHPSVSPSAYRCFQLELCPSGDNPTSNIIRPSSFSPLNLQFLSTVIIPFSLQIACLPVPLMQSHLPAPRPFRSLVPPPECTPIITSPRRVCIHALLKVFA